MTGYLKVFALLFTLPGVLHAQQKSAACFEIDGGGGLFLFLNGPQIGGTLGSSVYKGMVGLRGSVWVASPDETATGFDMSGVLFLKNPGAGFYAAAGPGYLWNRELKGMGYHFGAGWLAPPGQGPGARVAVTFHRYSPNEGVPFLALMVTIVPIRVR